MEDTILFELRNFKIFDSFAVKENSARIIYYFFGVFFARPILMFFAIWG